MFTKPTIMPAVMHTAKNHGVKVSDDETPRRVRKTRETESDQHTETDHVDREVGENALRQANHIILHIKVRR